MAAKNIDPLGDDASNPAGPDGRSIEAGAQDFVDTCGVCHVGGGQLEYDRDMADYSPSSPSGDYYVFNYPTLDNPNPVAPSPGFMDATNKAEMDCLMCHLGNSGNGRAFLQSIGCDDTTKVGPANDANCDGATDPGYPPQALTAGPYQAGTAYDMFNRNLGLKNHRLDLAASMGAGATAVWDASGAMAGIDWGTPATDSSGNFIVSGANIAATPNSSNCAVCHARDDNTPGLTGMMAMKYGYGNYALMFQAGEMLDTDSSSGSNDFFWFDLGCKTGMGKRTHKITQTGDYVGPNGRYGMSMFMTSTLDADPLTIPNMGDPIPNKMPDIDVHNAAGMQCGTCHYALGSIDKNHDSDGDGTIDSRLFPADDHHHLHYPDEVVMGMDHQFAQGDSYPDTKSKNNLDGTSSCESCHMTQSHPRSAGAPIPGHIAFPQLHIDKIACATCHIPEVYGAPGRLKYRDWTVGLYRNTFRNMLDWNFDLVTGSHKPMPVMKKWLTKFGETKIYPVLPSVMPIWVEAIANSQTEAGSEATAPADPNGYQTSTTMMSPVKARDNAIAALAVQSARPEFDIRLNGGNVIPLFDGFSLPDSWEIDKKPEIDAMIDSFAANTEANVKKLKLFQADFDVTHGIVPAEWALGGPIRGCASCHSSADPQDPDYSPNSVAFFEGKIQPLDNAGMGIGGYEPIKNWFALFADYDCTAMCDPMGMNDAGYFDSMNNAPLWGTACTWDTANGGMFDTIDQCVGMMTDTFDAVMGFPGKGTCDASANTCSGGAYDGYPCGSDADCPGTSMAMGMWDGIAGLQGFTIRETVAGGTLGCQPFAGPAYRSPVNDMGMNVNNCMPNDPMFNGTCVGADPLNGMPGGCDGGFRGGSDCMSDTDCQGAITDTTELAQNPYGLLYARSEVRSHFKIDLQQSQYGGIQRITWPIGAALNPGSPDYHDMMDGVANGKFSLDWAGNCWDYSNGNPMAPGVKPCGDGDSVVTVIPANMYLGYNDNMLDILKEDMTSPYFDDLYAEFQFDADEQTTGKVTFYLTLAKCPDTDCRYDFDLGDDNTATTTDSTTPIVHTYAAAGEYGVTLTVTDVDAAGDDKPGYFETKTRTVTAASAAPAQENNVAFTQTDNVISLSISEGGNGISKIYALWGDSSYDVLNPYNNETSMSHTYSANSTYYVRVYVYDDSGQRVLFEHTVTVNNL